jgi:hypothetical protein
MYVNSRQDKHSKWTALVVWILLDFSIRYVSVYKPNTTLACFTWEVLEVRNFHKRPNHVRSFWGFRNDVYMQAQHSKSTLRVSFALQLYKWCCTELFAQKLDDRVHATVVSISRAWNRSEESQYANEYWFYLDRLSAVTRTVEVSLFQKNVAWTHCTFEVACNKSCTVYVGL